MRSKMNRVSRAVLLLIVLGPALALAQQVMDHGSHQGMNHGSMDMQDGGAPSNARGPDAYADGLEHSAMSSHDMNDDPIHAQLMLDRLEYTRGGDEDGLALDGQAWVGTDLNKLWIKVETERSGGRWGSTRAEALWDHAMAPYWSLQSGLRRDSGDGLGRTWAAFGVRGLAPYWFEVQATAYAGESGRTALRLEAEYDLLLTQRLILQPLAEVNVYGQSDPERGIGAGLSTFEAGLRLRYEVSRKVAPYIGVTWHRKFGSTAGYARSAGEDASETSFVAGIKLWF